MAPIERDIGRNVPGMGVWADSWRSIVSVLLWARVRPPAVAVVLEGVASNALLRWLGSTSMDGDELDVDVDDRLGVMETPGADEEPAGTTTSDVDFLIRFRR
jgi:hypothetical protein